MKVILLFLVIEDVFGVKENLIWQGKLNVRFHRYEEHLFQESAIRVKIMTKENLLDTRPVYTKQYK